MERPTWGSRAGLSVIDGWKHRLQEIIRYTPSGDSIPEETWRSRHRKILISLVAHVPLLLALGLYDGTESTFTGARIPATPTWLVLGELGIVAAIALLANWSRFERRTRTALASFGLMTTSTLLVQFSGGYIEAHFHFFVVVGVIAIYEDWLPFAIGLLYVATGHAVFSMINPTRVYNHPAAIEFPWAWAVIHAVFILALSAALISNWYSIERSREQSEARLQQVAEQTDRIERVEEARTEAEEAKAEADARREEVEQLNQHLETKADAYSTTMARAADGVLTARLDTESDSEAMTRIGEAFNEMIEEIDGAMGTIQTFSREVSTASERTTTGVTGAEEASEQVSRSIRSISTSADEQRKMLEDVSGEMNSLSATIEEAAASAQTVADTSEETAEIATTGETTAQEAIESMEGVQETIDSTVENVKSLDDQMSDIGEIVDLISDIAEQTNLLALNAGIEAARAGSNTEAESSDGFSVVADEVKQLAEETKGAATEIEALIAETQARTETTVDEVRTADRHIREGADAVEEVADSLSSVANNTQRTNRGIQEINRATDDQAASMEETVAMIEPVADISRTTAEEAEGVSATAADQVSSMRRVSSESESLSERADRLQGLLADFEVGGSRA